MRSKCSGMQMYKLTNKCQSIAKCPNEAVKRSTIAVLRKEVSIIYGRII
jgi:hypothetical protein